MLKIVGQNSKLILWRCWSECEEDRSALIYIVVGPGFAHGPNGGGCTPIWRAVELWLVPSFVLDARALEDVIVDFWLVSSDASGDARALAWAVRSLIGSLLRAGCARCWRRCARRWALPQGVGVVCVVDGGTLLSWSGGDGAVSIVLAILVTSCLTYDFYNNYAGYHNFFAVHMLMFLKTEFRALTVEMSTEFLACSVQKFIYERCF